MLLVVCPLVAVLSLSGVSEVHDGGTASGYVRGMGDNAGETMKLEVAGERIEEAAEGVVWIIGLA